MKENKSQDRAQARGKRSFEEWRGPEQVGPLHNARHHEVIAAAVNLFSLNVY